MQVSRRSSVSVLAMLIVLLGVDMSRADDQTRYLPFEKRDKSPGNSTYHINPSAGDDSLSGLSANQAWKTFHPLNRLILAAGDKVEVMTPGAFDHSLDLAGAGTAEKPVEIRFAPGRYDFDPVNARRETYHISNTNADPAGLKAVGLHLNRARHVRITGSGAVIHARGKMMHVCIDGSEDITIDGLAFDYHRPTVSEFTVTAVGEDYADLAIHKDSTYLIKDAALVWQGEGWTETGGLGQELDPQTGRVRRMRDPLAGLRLEETKPFLVRAHGKHRLKANLIYQIRNPFRDYCGAFTRNSRNITWRNVHFRFIHGMGLVSQFTENITFDAVRIAPDPASGRTTAAWADCIQVSSCRGKVLVRNGEFSGAHDDAINIHGTHLRVVETQPDRSEVKVRFIHDQTYGFPAFLPGDEVEFVRKDSLATYGPNRVASSDLLDPHTMLLRLEKALPEDIRENDVLENVTWTPEVEIRGCTVRHIPTRGFLITTRRPVLVEDNDFHATHMPGILIENDASGWFESGCVKDMLIRNNRFHLCGEPAIHINPRNSIPNSEVHRNIRIENNEFTLMGSSGVKAHSTSGLRVTGNRFISKTGSDDARAIQTTDCAEVEIRDNRHEQTKE